MADRVRPARSKPTPEQEKLQKVAEEGAATEDAQRGAKAAMAHISGEDTSKTPNPTTGAAGRGRGQPAGTYPGATEGVTNPGQATQAVHQPAKTDENDDELTNRTDESTKQQDQASKASTHGSSKTGSGQKSSRSGRD